MRFILSVLALILPSKVIAARALMEGVMASNNAFFLSTTSPGGYANFGGTITLKSLNGVIVYANSFPGADLGVQINAADAALGANSGTIVIATGTIKTPAIVNSHDIWHDPGVVISSVGASCGITLNGTANLVGTGNASNFFRAASSIAGGIIICSNGNNNRIAGISIDGNGANTPQPVAEVQLSGSGNILENFYIKNSTYGGVNLNGTGAGSPVIRNGIFTGCYTPILLGKPGSGAKISGVQFLSNTGAAIYAYYYDGLVVTDNFFYDNDLVNNPNGGQFGIAGGSNTIISHNYILQDQLTPGELVHGIESEGSQILIQNNLVVGASCNGISVEAGRGVTVSGNIVVNSNSGYNAGTCSGIALAGNLPISDSIVSDNLVISTQSSPSQVYGINVATTTTNLRVSGNVIRGYQTAESLIPSYTLGVSTMYASSFNVPLGSVTVRYSLTTIGPIGAGIALPTHNFDVAGSNSSPSLAADGGPAQIDAGNNGLAFGAYTASPFTFWIQSKTVNNSTAAVPLVLNPLGGAVSVGGGDGISTVASLVVYGVSTTSTTAPTVACTAGSPSLTSGSNSQFGSYTAGALATGCTVTFTQSFPKSPFCVCQASANLVVWASATATNSVTCSSVTAMTGDTITYRCDSAP